MAGHEWPTGSTDRRAALALACAHRHDLRHVRVAVIGCGRPSSTLATPALRRREDRADNDQQHSGREEPRLICAGRADEAREPDDSHKERACTDQGQIEQPPVHDPPRLLLEGAHSGIMTHDPRQMRAWRWGCSRCGARQIQLDVPSASNRVAGGICTRSRSIGFATRMTTATRL